MSTIVLRSVKNAPLTNAEVDSNFTNLNTDKTELGGTYSAGTANGVLFLSSSKVLTTGSALTFDGTRLTSTTGKFGGGAASNSASLMVNNATNTATGIQLFQDGIESWIMGMPANSAGLAWSASGSEQMRLTSTGLGIGTSSPGQKLTVAGSANLLGRGSGFAFMTPDWRMYNSSSGNAFVWDNYATEFMRLDSSGNLGLGVTPSAWTDYKVFQVGGAYLFGYNNDELGMGQGAYYGSGWKYSATGVPATWFSAYQGAYKFFTAPSGTAGDAISFSQVMTLDASGNLSAGTTRIASSIQTNGITAGSVLATVGALSAHTTNAGILEYQPATNAVSLRAYGNTAGSGYIVFKTGGGGDSEDTERARIDSSGRLIVGSTASNGDGSVEGVARSNSTPGVVAGSRTSGDTGSAALLVTKFDNDSTTSQVFQRFSINNNSTASGQINANGANQVAFGSWSDARLKENIVDLPLQLANVMALRPVEFDYIESEGGGHQTGFIAQELQAVYPDAVGEREDGMLTVTGWSKTEARLVKAIQEQQAIINSLKARLDAANL